MNGIDRIPADLVESVHKLQQDDELGRASSVVFTPCTPPCAHGAGIAEAGSWSRVGRLVGVPS
jgi:hypothetical protein